MTCGIYKIENKLNGKIYVGQSIQIEARWKQHIAEGKNIRREKGNDLYKDINQLGEENFSFEILEECDRELLNEREKYWIKFYDSFSNGYNQTSGGQSECFIYEPEQFYKLWDEGKTVGEITEIIGCSPTITRQRLKGYKDYTESESRHRGAVKMTHKTLSEKEYQKLAERLNIKTYPVYQYSLLGDFIAEYECAGDASRKLNNKYLSDTIGRCIGGEANSAGGFQWSKEKVDKMKPVASPHGRLIRCITTGQIFSNSREAAEYFGIKSKANVGEACREQRKTAGVLNGEKLYWEYIE